MIPANQASAPSNAGISGKCRLPSVEVDPLFTKYPEDSGRTQKSHRLHMLVAVKKATRRGSSDVPVEGFKAAVRVLITLMNPGGRIVGNKHINTREGVHNEGDLFRRIQVVTARLVPPTPPKAPKGEPAEGFNPAVQIHKPIGQRAVGVVIAADSESAARTVEFRSARKGGLMEVTAGDQHVDLGAMQVPHKVVLVGDGDDVHRDPTARSWGGVRNP